MKVIYDIIGVREGAPRPELVEQLSDDAKTIIFIIRNDNPAIKNTVDVTEQRKISQDILLDQRRCEGAQKSMAEFAFKYGSQPNITSWARSGASYEGKSVIIDASNTKQYFAHFVHPIVALSEMLILLPQHVVPITPIAKKYMINILSSVNPVHGGGDICASIIIKSCFVTVIERLCSVGCFEAEDLTLIIKDINLKSGIPPSLVEKLVAIRDGEVMAAAKARAEEEAETTQKAAEEPRLQAVQAEEVRLRAEDEARAEAAAKARAEEEAETARTQVEQESTQRATEEARLRAEEETNYSGMPELESDPISNLATMLMPPPHANAHPDDEAIDAMGQTSYSEDSPTSKSSFCAIL